MRLLPTLALVMTLLAGGLVGGEAFGRDRDRRGHRDDDGGGSFGGGRDASLVQRRNRGDDADARPSRMSAAQAAREAQQRYGGGRVLSVDSMGGGYRVKLLRDGDVRVVFISDH